MQKKRRLPHILFICYLCVLFRITVFRSSFGSHGLCENGVINLKLFEEYIPLIQRHNWSRVVYLFVGNIIWFIPLGMYVKYRMAKSKTHIAGILWAVLSGAMLSFFVETMQYIFGTGISELDDLVLNTAGSLCGALSMLPLCSHLRHCFFFRHGVKSFYINIFPCNTDSPLLPMGQFVKVDFP